MNIELNESNCSDPDLHGTYDPEEWISVSKNHFGDQFNGLAVLILSEAVKQLNKEKELYTHHGLLIVWSDVEPELVGPFSTAEERDKEAKRIRKENGNGSRNFFCRHGVRSWSQMQVKYVIVYI